MTAEGEHAWRIRDRDRTRVREDDGSTLVVASPKRVLCFDTEPELLAGRLAQEERRGERDGACGQGFVVVRRQRDVLARRDEEERVGELVLLRVGGRARVEREARGAPRCTGRRICRGLLEGRR